MTVLAFGCAPASAAGTSVQPTAAVEPGVTIDEGSPAAKEYALALTQARRTGSSGSTGSLAGSSEAPFGVGIRPPASPGSGGATPGRAHHRSRRGGRANSSAPAGGEAGRSAPSLPASVLGAARITTSSGDGSLLALLGGGVAILVLGGLGGVVLRHNRTPPSHA